VPSSATTRIPFKNIQTGNSHKTELLFKAISMHADAKTHDKMIDSLSNKTPDHQAEKSPSPSGTTSATPRPPIGRPARSASRVH
jgi:hypothetical protein